MQDEVNQDYSEQNEVDGMKKGAEKPKATFSAPRPYSGENFRVFPLE